MGLHVGGRTGVGVARGPTMGGGAGVMGVNSEGVGTWSVNSTGGRDWPCRGEVGREKAVAGLTGGSMGERGGAAPAAGKELLLPLMGWLEMMPEGKYPANGMAGGSPDDGKDDDMETVSSDAVTDSTGIDKGAVTTSCPGS